MPVVFLDRDGVINRKPPEGDYVKSWAEFEFLVGAPEALRLLKRHGFRVIVATNQRGVSLGRLREADLAEIHRRLRTELHRAGAEVDAIYCCPHERNSCQCRKPAIGMFLRAQQDFPDIDWAQGFVVGDSLVDMEAATQLGCRKVLIGSATSALASALAAKKIQVDFFARSLLAAVTDFLVPAVRPLRVRNAR